MEYMSNNYLYLNKNINLIINSICDNDFTININNIIDIYRDSDKKYYFKYKYQDCYYILISLYIYLLI